MIEKKGVEVFAEPKSAQIYQNMGDSRKHEGRTCVVADTCGGMAGNYNILILFDK